MNNSAIMFVSGEWSKDGAYFTCLIEISSKLGRFQKEFDGERCMQYQPTWRTVAVGFPERVESKRSVGGKWPCPRLMGRGATQSRQVQRVSSRRIKIRTKEAWYKRRWREDLIETMRPEWKTSRRSLQSHCRTS